MGELTDLGLTQLHVPQWTFYAQLPHRDKAGAVVTVVVHVGALRYRGEPVLLGNATDLLKQLVFAEVAAVFRVLAEAVDVQLLGLADDVADAVLCAEILRLLQLAPGERARGRCDGDHAVTQHVVGDPQQKGRVDAAGKRHRHAAEGAEVCLQVLIFFG